MTDFNPKTSCATDELPSVLTVAQAREQILTKVTPLSSWQKVAIRQGLDQVLATPLTSPVNVPPHSNSAMDGFALRLADLTTNAGTLKQVGTAFAGRPFSGFINPGECVAIMTGAMLPANCDTVIMQENTERQGNLVTFHGQAEQGQNVRLAGEDIAAGDSFLPAGKRLTPADLGLIASLGIAEINVKRPLRVAFFSTGDELRAIGEPLSPGDIYDSNRYTLYGMLSHLGADILDMGVVKDNPEALREALITAATEADVVLTSGGVSVGEADFIKQILAEIGSVNFWKIAMKPGRPLAFGQILDTPFFGLPGNPVSVMVTFYQFVKPALEKLAGEKPQAPLLVEAIASAAIRKRPGRFEFQRGRLSTIEGQLTVTMTGEQGSGILRSMSLANCFILLDEHCSGIASGESVTVQPFAGLI